MPVQLVASSKPVRDQVTAEEWAARVELAAGHRVLAHYGVNDLTYNHFGLRVPGELDHMLIKRTDWMFSEVTASSLLKVDFAGNVLTDLVGAILGERNHLRINLDRKGAHGITTLLTALGRLSVAGIAGRLGNHQAGRFPARTYPPPARKAP